MIGKLSQTLESPFTELILNMCLGIGSLDKTFKHNSWEFLTFHKNEACMARRKKSASPTVICSSPLWNSSKGIASNIITRGFPAVQKGQRFRVQGRGITSRFVANKTHWLLSSVMPLLEGIWTRAAVAARDIWTRSDKFGGYAGIYIDVTARARDSRIWVTVVSRVREIRPRRSLTFYGSQQSCVVAKAVAGDGVSGWNKIPSTRLYCIFNISLDSRYSKFLYGEECKHETYLQEDPANFNGCIANIATLILKPRCGTTTTDYGPHQNTQLHKLLGSRWVGSHTSQEPQHL
jgi:hypothetical protein